MQDHLFFVDHYLFFFIWPLYCLSFVVLRLLIIPWLSAIGKLIIKTKSNLSFFLCQSVDIAIKLDWNILFLTKIFILYITKTLTCNDIRLNQNEYLIRKYNQSVIFSKHFDKYR